LSFYNIYYCLEIFSSDCIWDCKVCSFLISGFGTRV
jgi:hypothetical protein